MPNDAYYGNQWYLKRIIAPQAWDTINKSPDIIVAVIDSGVQTNHPDLRDNLWLNTKEIPNNKKDDDQNGYIDDYYGWDFVNHIPDPNPKFNLGFSHEGMVHGTVIAGILAAQGDNKRGVTGVTWQTKIMNLKALDDQGQTDANKIIEAINYAVNHGARIINLSFAGFSYSHGVQQAIRRAYDHGVVVVAAAGNDISGGYGSSLDRQPLYPVCHDDPNGDNLVIGVAATGPLDQKAFFSSYGKNCIDITAPGLSFYSTSLMADKYNIQDQPFNKYYDGYWSGTSFAVPLVSGTLALMMQTNPSLKPRQIVELLLSSADNLDKANPNFIGQLGRGRLNMAKAVEAAAHYHANTSRLLFSQDNRQIYLLNEEKKVETLFSVGDDFKTGFNLASGDLNNDGQAEIIVAAKAGNPPWVKIFNQNGQLLNSWLAYKANFLGGVQIAVGDVNNNGLAEIITGPGAGYQPEVRIFNQSGKLLGSFLAYAKNFSGGVNLAVGDLDYNGYGEIVTAPASRGGPHIRIFNNQGRVINQFMAFDKEERNGYQVAVAAVYNSTKQSPSKIIVAPGPQMSPYLKIFNQQGRLEWRFAPLGLNLAGGLAVLAGDLNQNGQPEIIAAPLIASQPEIKIYENLKIIKDSIKLPGGPDSETAANLSLTILNL